MCTIHTCTSFESLKLTSGKKISYIIIMKATYKVNYFKFLYLIESFEPESCEISIQKLSQ